MILFFFFLKTVSDFLGVVESGLRGEMRVDLFSL